MDTKTEVGLNFKRIQSNDAFVDHCVDIRKLVNAYIVSAGDKYTSDEIMNLMQIASPQSTFFLLIIYYDELPVGLLTAHAVVHNDSNQGGMVHIGYIDQQTPKDIAQKILDGAMSRLDEWAAENKFKNLFIQTSRIERSFDKLIFRFGFKRITTIYEKEIKYG